MILTGAGAGYYFHISSVLDELEVERAEIYEKTKIIENLESSYNDMIFRARGYYAFQDNNERDQLAIHLIDFKEYLNEFGEVADSDQELLLYNDLVEFIRIYEVNVLPRAISLVENDDYSGLRLLANGGTNETVNQFLDFTRANQAKATKRLNEIYTESVQTADQYTLLTLLFSAIILLILIVVGFFFLSKFLRKMEDLKQAANALAEGKEVSSDIKNHNDEIWALNQSFYQMSRVIQKKEEELTAQSDELQAQQDQYSDQQNQMKD